MGTTSYSFPRYVLSELVETEKMYVDDLGQIVEVMPPFTPFSLCLLAYLSFLSAWEYF